MKKLFLFIAIAGALFCAPTLEVKAQKTTTVAALTTTSYGKALDTVLSTATKVTTPIKLSSWNLGVTAQVVVTKISGTVGGSIGLYGSMDGTNFSLIGSAATASDATANYSFNTTVGWKWFRISYTGASGQSASFKSFLMPY